MPTTKGQKIVFGIIMSITMAYGMEFYNNAINYGATIQHWNFSMLSNIVFWNALKEMSFMWIIVFVVSNLWGNRIGQEIAHKIIKPESDNPFFITIIISCCTVLIMCPSMSLIGAILFNIILGGQSIINLPAIWVGTVIKNFPMALIWNLFFAGPLTRLLFKSIYKKQLNN